MNFIQNTWFKYKNRTFVICEVLREPKNYNPISYTIREYNGEFSEPFERDVLDMIEILKIENSIPAKREDNAWIIDKEKELYR